MILLSTEQSCLLELLKAALFELTPTISEAVNWDKVYYFAKAQCVVSLTARFVPLAQRKQWSDLSYQGKAYYMQMLYEQKTLVNLFKDNSIPFVIIKGTAAAQYFPHPSLRAFGDIDFYVSKTYFYQAKSLLQNNGYIFVSNNDRQSVYEKNGIEFELHNRISRQGVYDIDHLILDNLNDVVDCCLDGVVFPCLPKYKNGLVLLWHLAHHLNGSGIGLRQIIDWMMFVHKELDDSTWDNHFREIAVEAGLEKLAVTVTYMCKKWLGLPNSFSWCDDADDKLADQLLFRVLDDGNFGHDRALSEFVKESIKREGLFPFLQRAGFENWELAQKHVLLRPFAWLYQLLRFGFRAISGLVYRKKVFRHDKNIMKREELLRKLK